jgi:hypothetical protein
MISRQPWLDEDGAFPVEVTGGRSSSWHLAAPVAQ